MGFHDEGSFRKAHVSVRIRPGCEPRVSPQNVHKVRYSSRLTEDWHWEDNSIHLGEEEDSHVGTFHTVFPPESTNKDVYEKFVSPLVSEFMNGYNATLITIGQSNSGKTHTIWGNPSDPGILPQVVETVMSSPPNSTLLISIIELYNETLRDLLVDQHTPQSSTPERKPALIISKDSRRGTCVANARTVQIHTLSELYTILRKADQKRVTSSNNAHETASRSHLVFQLTYSTVGTDSTTFQILELAGTESIINYDSASTEEVIESMEESFNISHTTDSAHRQREDEVRCCEGVFVRKSLLALFRCIELVTLNQSNARWEALRLHYRDSKLTRFLCDSLEGSTVTALICMMNPNEQRESLANLRIADLVQSLETAPKRTSFTIRVESPTSTPQRDPENEESIVATTSPLEVPVKPLKNRFRSSSPHGEVFQGIIQQNTNAIEKHLTNHMLEWALARLPDNWVAMMKDKEQQLDDVLESTLYAQTILDQANETIRLHEEMVESLETEVASLDADVDAIFTKHNTEKIVLDCLATQNPRKEAQLQKCQKYIDQLLGNTHGWKNLKDSTLTSIGVRNKRSPVDPALVADLQDRLNCLIQHPRS